MEKVYEIYKNDEIFPDEFLNISGCPKKIYAIGNIALLRLKKIAIVGSRKSTEYGRTNTRKIVKDLVSAGYVIVSGLAIGIDGVAHQACIDCGGKTIAVIASGFNHMYPRENLYLYNEILQTGGLIISEYPPEKEIEMKNFPKRNRIISGLSDGIIVIEAARRSGTTITGNLAIAQGKMLFCLPNSVGNRNSDGTFDLIQKGGILIRSGRDVVNNLKKIKETEHKWISNVDSKDTNIKGHEDLNIEECEDANIIENEGLYINNALLSGIGGVNNENVFFENQNKIVGFTSNKEHKSRCGEKDSENFNDIYMNLNKDVQLRILDDDSKLIVNCITQNEFSDAEKISKITDIEISKVNSILTMLEIDEIIVDTGKNGYKVLI